MTEPISRRNRWGLLSLVLALSLASLLVLMPSGERVWGQGSAIGLGPGDVLLMIYRDSYGAGTAIVTVQSADTETFDSTGRPALPIAVTVRQNGTTLQGSGFLPTFARRISPIEFSLTAPAGQVYDYSGGLMPSATAWTGGGIYMPDGETSFIDTDAWTMYKGISLQSASAGSLPTFQVALGPSTLALPPRGSGNILYSRSARPPAGLSGGFDSYSDQPAAVSDDGSAITIVAPAGFVVATDQGCAPFDGHPNVVGCPAGEYPSFTTVEAAAPAQPLPQTVMVSPPNGTALFVAPPPDGDAELGPAVITVRTEPDCCREPAPVQLDWDGQTLTATAPAGYEAHVSGLSGCDASSGQGNIVTCPATGLPAQLVTIGAAGPILHPPGRTPPPFLDLRLIAPASASAEQTLTISVTLTPFGHPEPPTYVWDFGDGSMDIGQTVTHAYAQPGNYTISISLFAVSSISSRGTVVESQTAQFTIGPAAP